MPQTMISRIKIAVTTGNALTENADVLVLKYAQYPYGADQAAIEHLENVGIDVANHLPPRGKFFLVRSRGALGASDILFVGVDTLDKFRYEEIREFSCQALQFLSAQRPDSHHILFTIHGPGYGLDEAESFRAEVAGFADSIENGAFPQNLESITIIEQNPQRSKRLGKLLQNLLPLGSIPIPGKVKESRMEKSAVKELKTAGKDSASKPHIFVAMPFSEEFQDIFDYGIRSVVNAAGFLCERVDTSSFTGDILTQIKERISTSSLVIADLTSANPNVYLEVGYAWGCGRPTVLLVKDPKELKFDVQSQRCLIYKRIKDVEESLKQELTKLQESISFQSS